MSGEITQLLAAMEAGEEGAWERLVPLVYAELRGIAGGLMRGERAGHAWQPTELVHEAVLRLDRQEAAFAGRRHFFAAAATAMRRLLVDQARRRDADKRGGDWARVSLSDAQAQADSATEVDILDLHEALTELEEQSERQARLVELRFFAGLTIEEAAQQLGVSPRTARGDWLLARTWLFKRLRRDADS